MCTYCTSLINLQQFAHYYLHSTLHLCLLHCIYTVIHVSRCSHTPLFFCFFLALFHFHVFCTVRPAYLLVSLPFTFNRTCCFAPLVRCLLRCVGFVLVLWSMTKLNLIICPEFTATLQPSLPRATQKTGSFNKACWSSQDSRPRIK